MQNGYSIRPATENEAKEIRRLIYFYRINPMGLDWRRFLVAVDDEGQILGCGQVKPHGDGTRELASIAVWQKYQKQGIASAIIHRLIEENPPPLYLTSRASLGTFYERFGFRVVPDRDLSPYFRRIKRIVRFLRTVSKVNEDLLVMVRD